MKLITFLTNLNSEINLNSETIAVFEKLGCKNLQRNIDIYEYFTEITKNNPKWSKDACINETAEEFGLKPRYIYIIIAKFSKNYI
jgi:hypothetical protein